MTRHSVCSFPAFPASWPLLALFSLILLLCPPWHTAIPASAYPAALRDPPSLQDQPQPRQPPRSVPHQQRRQRQQRRWRERQQQWNHQHQLHDLQPLAARHQLDLFNGKTYVNRAKLNRPAAAVVTGASERQPATGTSTPSATAPTTPADAPPFNPIPPPIPSSPPAPPGGDSDGNGARQQPPTTGTGAGSGDGRQDEVRPQPTLLPDESLEPSQPADLPLPSAEDDGSEPIPSTPPLLPPVAPTTTAAPTATTTIAPTTTEATASTTTETQTATQSTTQTVVPPFTTGFGTGFGTGPGPGQGNGSQPPMGQPFFPSPTPDLQRTTCFPGDATVVLRGGRRVRMDELRTGQEVLSSSMTAGREGDDEHVYSAVFAFTHRDRDVVAQFVELETPAGKLVATASHYVLIAASSLKTTTSSPSSLSSSTCTAKRTRRRGRCGASSGTIDQAQEVPLAHHAIPAGSVRVGMQLVAGTAGDNATVTAVRLNVARRGLYNPQTVSGTLVVNGVRVSAYTQAVAVGPAHALLLPLRATFSLLAHWWRWVGGSQGAGGGGQRWTWRWRPNDDGEGGFTQLERIADVYAGVVGLAV